MNKSVAYLYGTPPFCLFYWDNEKQEFIGKDLSLIRPCIEDDLKCEKKYDCNLYYQNDKVREIKVGGKMYKIL